MDESILREAGHRLYITSRWKEMKRYLVFRARCRLHKDIVGDFLDFFAETQLRKDILKGTPAFIEQVTRAFFYKGSNFAERSALIKNHVRYMEKHFTEQAISELYVNVVAEMNYGQKLVLWEDTFEDIVRKYVEMNVAHPFRDAKKRNRLRHQYRYHEDKSFYLSIIEKLICHSYAQTKVPYHFRFVILILFRRVR